MTKPKPQPWIVNAGDLRHRVQIQQPESDTLPTGEPTTSWTTILTGWAKIEYATGREQYQPGDFSSNVTHTITMRASKSVTILPGMQIVLGAHTYKIQAINDVDMRGVLWIFSCLEIDGGTN